MELHTPYYASASLPTKVAPQFWAFPMSVEIPWAIVPSVKGLRALSLPPSPPPSLSLLLQEPHYVGYTQSPFLKYPLYRVTFSVKTPLASPGHETGAQSEAKNYEEVCCEKSVNAGLACFLKQYRTLSVWGAEGRKQE